MTRGKRLSVLVVALALTAPADAAARDFAVTSFDGTRIEAHFFPAAGLSGGRAPTVLFGPGWGNGGTTNGDRSTSERDGTIGVGALRRAGYNVLTWDPRGFGASGGEAKWDSPHYEARDVQVLIDALAGIPEAELDGPGDPRVGMAGASYGGGIQWVTAAIDSRVDAITPVVAWHSMVTSLYKDATFKAGWAGVLCGTGTAQGVSTGLVNPAGVQTGSMDAHMYSICQSGLAAGRLLDRDRNWLGERGPQTAWMDRVRAPALILHGTVDTLFTLSEAVENFRVLRSNGVPARMMWFCGGHGNCQTSNGLAGYWAAAVLRWFRHHLKGERLVGTGPRFEWIDQHGIWHRAADYPLADDGTLSATGKGTLQLVAGDAGSSGTAITATPASHAVEVQVRAPERHAQLVGAPELELEYSGQGTLSSVRAFAQVVDADRKIVVGGQVTPLPLLLDGRTHTLRRSLETLAYAVGPSSSLKLQIIPATNVYGPQRANGRLELARIALRLPLGKSPTDTEPGPSPAPPSCSPAFYPRSVKLRSGRRVRFRPRVRCGGRDLRVRVRISDGKRRWARRSGRVARIRVRPRARRLVVRFRHEGRVHRAKVPISRR